MERKQFVCDKCGCQHYTSDQFQATGGTSPKFSMFKTKNLPLSAVNNAAIPNFTAVRLLMAGTF